jgi:acyl carrier protein
MDKEKVALQLIEVMTETFGEPGIKIDKKSTIHNTEGWDSMSHLNLILNIEERFHIEFTIEAIEGGKSFENILNYVADRIVK